MYLDIQMGTHTSREEELILRRSLAAIKRQFTCQLATVPSQPAIQRKYSEKTSGKTICGGSSGTHELWALTFALSATLCLVFSPLFFYLSSGAAVSTIFCIIHRRDWLFHLWPGLKIQLLSPGRGLKKRWRCSWMLAVGCCIQGIPRMGR